MSIQPISHPAPVRSVSRPFDAAGLRSPLLQGLLRGLVVYALAFAAVAAVLFATPAFLGTDDYYHARISAEIIEQGRLTLDFPWLPQTILSPAQFVDHHLLFHLYVAPFAFFGGVTGAKLATASIAAGVFLATWGLLRGIGVRFPALWTFALLGLSTPFLYRMLMVRTQGAALLLLIVTLHVLFQRRYRWLIALGFAFTWLYDGFLLILVFIALYVAAQFITDRRFEWRPFAYGLAGVALGLVINPYFPQNIAFIVEHLGAKVNFESGVEVGNEWYPYRTGTLLNNSAGALIALALGVLAPSFASRQSADQEAAPAAGPARDHVETTLLLAALLTLAMLFKSRRFIEYFPAFALLLAAAGWGRGRFDLRAWLPERGRAFWQGALRVGVAGVVLAAAVVVGLTYRETVIDAEDARDLETYAGASAWLRDNTPDGAPVFQTDWDDFTRLFFYNTANTYLVGLDPTYLERADPDLWDLWVDITQGEVNRPSGVIAREFGALYIVSDTRHADFVETIIDDPAVQLVYRDSYSYVWAITPEIAATEAP